MIKKICFDFGLNINKAIVFCENQIQKLYIENDKEDITGNIYIANIKKINPLTGATFVDIGMQKHAFLQLSPNSNLKMGMDVLVQVINEPSFEKGAKVSLNFSIQGKYFVLQKDIGVGISNKIKNENEKNRLLDIVKEFNNSNFGTIIRTNAENIDKENLKIEFEYLKSKFENIIKESVYKKSPNLMLEKLNLKEKIFIDENISQIKEIYLNDEKNINEIKKLIKIYNGEHIKINFNKSIVNILDECKIQNDWQSFFKRKLELKNGSYLIFDKTEAFTVIDVNSGSYKGQKNAEDSFLNVNKEAIKEIIRQVIFRNISGIILVDLIDMKKENSKKQLLEFIKSEIKKYNQKIFIYGFTNLGLLELSRKREGKALEQYYFTACKVCEKTGLQISNYEKLEIVYSKIKNTINHTNIKEIEVDFKVDNELKKEIEKLEKHFGILVKHKNVVDKMSLL